MHGAGGLPGRQVPQTVLRLKAKGFGHTWLYQFPHDQWRDAVRRIMADMRSGKLPDAAAGGLLEMIAEGVNDD